MCCRGEGEIKGFHAECCICISRTEAGRESATYVQSVNAKQARKPNCVLDGEWGYESTIRIRECRRRSSETH